MAAVIVYAFSAKRCRTRRDLLQPWFDIDAILPTGEWARRLASVGDWWV